MSEEARKRNTDCVYFLASPLTCKKGNDCEYRHSENARMNLRDCWYWLGGNCLNARCPFRHPPLDGRPTNAQDTTTTSTGRPTNNNNNTSLATPVVGRPTSLTYPSVKPKVSCYFFSQGLCSRGDNCTFLHNSSSEMPKPTTLLATENRKQLPLKNGEQRQESVGGPQKVLQEVPQKATLKVTQIVPEIQSIAQSVVRKMQEKVTEHVIEVILMPRKTAKGPVTKEQAFVKDRHLVQEADDELKREWEENAVSNARLGMDRMKNGRPPLRLSSSGYNVANGESEKAEFRSRYGYVGSMYCGQQTGRKSGDKRSAQSEKDLCHSDLRNHIGKRRKTVGTDNGQDDYDDGERRHQERLVRDCLDGPTQQRLLCHGRINGLASSNSCPDRNPIKSSPPRNRVNEHVLDPTNGKMGGQVGLNSFDFATPKSLAQIKAEKLANWKVDLSLALNGWKPDDESALDFDGPKHLNASLKEKSRPLSGLEARSDKEPLGANMKDKGDPLLEVEATIDGKANAKRLVNEAVSLQKLNPHPEDNGKADASEFMHLSRQPEEGKKSRIEANHGVKEGKHKLLDIGSANPLDTGDNDDNSDDDNSEFATRINQFFS